MHGERDAVEVLTQTLARACRALADAGQPRVAGQLSATGWAAIRGEFPAQARHLDGVMHYVARIEEHQERESVVADDQLLDVRSEVPRRRHELIFETFARLAPGSAYVLVNDHDPKPLQYQFDAELPGQFSWQYLEQGPDVWRVRIGRTLSEEADHAEPTRTGERGAGV